MSLMRLIKKIVKVFAAITISVILLIGIAIIATWIDHNAETRLPTPTGKFAVGRTEYIWTDTTQIDKMAPQPGTKRKLLAWIWYPAAASKKHEAFATYLPAPWQRAVERKSSWLMTHLLTRDLSRVRTHSIHNAEVSPELPSYPVVLMRAGLSALTASYTTLAEDLASHGYVVVGFDVPYQTFVVVLPDGQVIMRAPQNNLELLSGHAQTQLATKLVKAWSDNMRFALDELERLNTSDPTGRFRGRLNMQSIGVFGHSLGGATALQFCYDDPQCKAGIDIDGAPLGNVVFKGVTQPFMFLLGGHQGEPQSQVHQVMADIHSIYYRLPPNRRALLIIRGASHFMFSDNAVLKSPFLMDLMHILGIVHLDGRRQLKITAYCVHTFFDKYLKESDTSAFKIRAPQYPELQKIK